jgi:hypothetical protein
MALGCALALIPARKRDVLERAVPGAAVDDAPPPAPPLVEAHT